MPQPIPPASQASRSTAHVETEQVETFAYPSDPDAPYTPLALDWLIAPGEGGESADPHQASASFDERLAEESRRAFEAGRAGAFDEQRKMLAAAQTEAGEREKHHRAALLESFQAERDRYLQQAEHEVVRLALAIAARILRREAQMDPLLLTGAVRVALGQLSASTEVLLRVPATDLALWTEAIALLPNLPVKPTVTGEDALRLGECLLETKLGNVDLGIRSQLGEIERGFFDRAPAPQPVLDVTSQSAERRA
jgi:flagellar assembly protein FliH